MGVRICACVSAVLAAVSAARQRVLNENANGLFRQYLPKGCDFDVGSDAYFARIMARLNRRPRKCLAVKTPYKVFFARVIVVLRIFRLL